ncbi:MAG: TetR/AcrR family transcriptional regulator [Spirosomaceae bacterium]|jgi:AcrR family transcriptional regulator|nr:TetR/AcrR family transcriptional regulator [Spirosomataceae bacterium]
MKDTKSKILETSLRLFNERGYESITVRDIAKQMGISHGNLCYHFANTDVIVEHLYDRLLTEIDEQLLAPSFLQQVNLESLYRMIKHIFEKLYKYKFLMQDFVSIVRKNQVLKQKHRDLVSRRRTFFEMGLEICRYEGLLRDELIKTHFQFYFDQMFIISDYWLASAEVLYEGAEESKLDYYTKLAFCTLVPYLSEKGLAEYRKLSFF